MKPIIRWTIGHAKPSGFKVLQTSVQLINKLYKNQFDYFVLYNGPNPLDYVKTLEADVLDASKYSGLLPIPPCSSKWKLYPPRLNSDVHEIVMDNDVVIYNKLPHIDKFLNSQDFLVADGLTRRGLGRTFAKQVPVGKRLNSGIYGIPPNFDLQEALTKKITDLKLKGWTGWFDDQGILAAIMLNKKYIQIRPKDISIIPTKRLIGRSAKYLKGKYGMHFCGINRGHTEYYDRFLKELSEGKI